VVGEDLKSVAVIEEQDTTGYAHPKTGSSKIVAGK
jgi:hypothetical protein